ncbi:MAG: single-stranded DNA-binding protein [Acidaminococcales bacterium]|jgi:single-strand DNA-binding protein|nr:single-stranded DNA-binding protein [Acidaminococcales bacterium]
MNKVILVGRLTRDPVVRVTPSNKDVATFTLAVDRFSAGPDGKKEADFVPIVVWGRLAEVCGNNLSKGQKVLVDGRMQVRNYEDKTGQKRYVTEVVAQSVEFLEWRGGQSAAGAAPAAEGLPSGGGAFGPDIYPDDDVPF